MKFFVVAVFLAAIFGSINSLPRGEEKDLAERIRDVINKITADIPDSVGVQDVDIKIPSNDLINGDFDIEEISMVGLNQLSIDTLVFDQSKARLDYSFNFEDIVSTIETHLTLGGLVTLDHPLSVKVDFKNLKTEGYAVVDEDKKQVEDFNILITLEESNFDIKGLLNDDKLSEEVSKALTENVAKVLDAVNTVMSPFASKVIQDVINIALKLKE